MKVLVLLSGGIDSSTALGLAVHRFGRENVYALNILYGQKHDRELKAAKDVAKYYAVDYKVMDLSEIFKYSDSTLLKHSSRSIKHQSYAEQLEELGGSGTVDTYVPFRNGLMLSTAASYALSIGAEKIYFGAHRDDAAGRAYPDCTVEFNDAINEAIYEGSGRLLRVEAPFINQAKAEIEAQTKVLQAEAAAKVQLIEAQAAADANKLLSQSITPEILNKMEMEARLKWGWVTISGAGVLVNQ